MYHELLAKDQEKSKEMKALEKNGRDEQYGITTHRKPAKRPNYGGSDYDLTVGFESIVHIGENSGKIGNMKELQKEILHQNLKEAAKKERRPNSPRRALEDAEEGYFIGSNEETDVKNKHVRQLKYKTQLDEDFSYRMLNRDKSAFIDIQKSGLIYSMSDDNEEEKRKKMQDYRDALEQQRLEQEQRKREEKMMERFGRPPTSNYVSAAKYYG